MDTNEIEETEEINILAEVGKAVVIATVETVVAYTAVIATAAVAGIIFEKLQDRKARKLAEKTEN